MSTALDCCVIVQARMGSTRLPGKVLMPMGNVTVLEQVLRRCQRISLAREVCLATSDLERDDPVAVEAARIGVRVFRGSETDVLERYWMAAMELGCSEVLRVTADCPLIDPEVCDQVIKLRRTEQADYACNFDPAGFPHGLDCEAMSMAAMVQMQAACTDSFQREHVSLWLIENPDARKANLAGPFVGAPQQHRWTLDTIDDYRFLSAVFDRLPDQPWMLGWREVMAVIAADTTLAAASLPVAH